MQFVHEGWALDHVHHKFGHAADAPGAFEHHHAQLAENEGAVTPAVGQGLRLIEATSPEMDRAFV